MMKMKHLLALCTVALPLVVASQASAQTSAQNFPERPITLVVAYAAGGPVDSTARVVAKGLSAHLGKPVIVENKAGAGGAIGGGFVAKSAPDGYTLWFAANPTQTINPHIHRSLPYDPINDFTPVSFVAKYTNVLVVNNDLPIKTVSDLVSYAKAHPNKVNYGSAGIGASNHLSGELLSKITGAPMVHVPYKGNSPAMTDVMNGQLTFMFDITSTAINYINAGRVRVLAVTSPTRNAGLPNVPTMIEAGVPGFDVTGWYGVLGPKGMPRAVTDKLNQALKTVLSDPVIAQQLKTQGYDVSTSTPEEFLKTIQKDHDFWGKVVRDAQIEKS